MRRLIFTALLVFAATLPLAHAEDPVVIGVPNWPTVKITARVIQAIAEDRLGIKVELVDALNDEIFEAINDGSGKIDIHPEVWLPNHAEPVARYVDEAGTMVLAPTAYEAVQGLCIRRASAELLGLSDVHQLSDPEIAAKLDSDGDGRGDIWIGAEGWGSTRVERIKARTYGYDQVLDVISSEESDMLVRLEAAAREGRHFVFACYGPHHIFQIYNLMLIEEPAYDESRWLVVQPSEGENWLDVSSIDVGWPRVTVHIAYSKHLTDEAPALVDMLNRIQLNSRMVSGWTYAVEVEKVDPDAFAKDWVEANADLVAEWLGD